MRVDKKFAELLLAEIQEIKKDIKEVRQTDIPTLKIDMALTKSETSRSAKIITGIGGGLSLLLSTAVAAAISRLK